MQYKKLNFFALLYVLLGLTGVAKAQNTSNYWQQHVDYTMEVDMNVENFQYTGTQKLVYTNNSPDVINRVYYHLYFNAFQPGSEMDMRLQNIADPDGRMTTADKKSRIATLTETEVGYLHTTSLKQDGATVKHNEEGTVLVVDLAKPIPPGGKTTFDMEFKGQVPVTIRRSGRNNKEGIALSMAQWYPKLAEYDFEGWHADPYIAREFHGVWGDFDVKLTIDKNYVIGGTGYLQNSEEIGHGYEAPDTKLKKQGRKKFTWHFKAPQVHDFTWAADPDYLHDKIQVPGGPMLHFLYKSTMPQKNLDIWKKIQPKTIEFMQYYNDLVGKYPYKQYSIIQGGDGGMEYGMCTLVFGEGTYKGLLQSTLSHEIAHTWFQFLLASNEAKHEWMDEGFASYIEYKAVNDLFDKKMQNPWQTSYGAYFSLVKSGNEQPQTTYADRYTTNRSYSLSAYYKGSIFLSQLGYVIGQENLNITLKKYFNDFIFKHPVPNDIKRTAEKVSGMELDWYLTDWTQTTNTIDYAIKDVVAVGSKTNINLERIGLMPMPIDVLVVYNDGTQETFYASLRMMRGEKENPYPQLKRTVLEDWSWASNTYGFSINRPIEDIKGVIIDPSQLMADVNAANNFWSPKPMPQD